MFRANISFNIAMHSCAFNKNEKDQVGLKCVHLFPNNPNIFAQLDPPVFLPPLKVRGDGLTSHAREPRPFQVIFLQTKKVSFAEKKKKHDSRPRFEISPLQSQSGRPPLRQRASACCFFLFSCLKLILVSARCSTY